MKCPDCQAVLVNDGGCECGWRKKGEHVEDMRNARRCQYRHGGDRCLAPATLFDSVNGMDYGFCRWHFMSRGKSGYEIMQDLERNGVPRERDIIREEVEERAKEFERREAEGRREWLARLSNARQVAAEKFDDRHRGAFVKGGEYKRQ